MNTLHSESRPSHDDPALRSGMRQALRNAPADGLAALESRALQQWRHHHGPARAHGPVAALQLGWRQHPGWFSSGLLALAIVVVLAARSWMPSDPGIDELMQPDVLSLISMGEL